MTFEQLKQLKDDGVSLCRKGLYQEAQIKLYRVFNSSEEYIDLHIDVGIHLAALYRKLESYSAAIDLLEYLSSRSDKDDTNRFKLSLERAYVHFEQRDYDVAHEHLLIAKSLINENISVQQLWYYYNVEGYYYIAKKDHPKAMTSFSNVLTITMLLNSQEKMKRAYYNMGTTHAALNNIQQSIEFSSKSLALCKTYGDEYLEALNHQTLMYDYFKQDDVKSAKYHASCVFSLAYKNEYKSIIRDTCYQIGSYYKKRGDDDIANVFFEKASNADPRIPLDIMKQVEINIINSGGLGMGEG